MITITLYVQKCSKNFYIGDLSNPKEAYSCGFFSVMWGQFGSPGYIAGLPRATLQPPLRVQS